MQRVTQRMVVDQFQSNLSDIFGRLAKVHDQLSSGQQIRRPSDDPTGTNKALFLRSSIQLGDQLIRDIDLSKTWLETSESALATLNEALQRAKELAVQGANDTLNTNDRLALSKELDQLVGGALAAANTNFLGSYVFAGTKTTTKPFPDTIAAGTVVTTTVPSPQYSGDTNTMPREIGPNLRISINTTGDQLLTVIKALVDLRDALDVNSGVLNAGTSSAITKAIGGVDAGIDQVSLLQSVVGARVNRFDAAEERLKNVQFQLASLLSKTQDIDVTETASKFALEQTVYQAALKAGANAIHPSLLDFLR